MKKQYNREQPDFGITDKHGHWRPPYPSTYSPLFEKPVSFKEFLKFLFGWGGYIWPRHVLYAGLAFFTYYVLQPGFAVTREFAAGWILLMFARNIALIWIIAGGWHLILYTLKLHGKERKYHPKWQAKNEKRFLFNNQTWDNIFWSCISGAAIWTVYEVFYMWAAARGIVPLISFDSRPLLFIALFFLIPLWREAHFYFIHRLIHWKPLFRAVHKIHHYNFNPGPWSGMAMHPVEHILYLSVVLIHFIVPSNPVHFFYNAQLTALTPAGGHHGFEGPLFKGLVPSGDYFHYLHHKHVTCNFGTTIIPWDRWLGVYYNGEGEYKTKNKK